MPANNKFQIKRTSTSGRTPNTTGSYATNSQYIAAGELALNMTDGILYTSDGTNLIYVGANQVNQRITNSFTIDNSKQLKFSTVNTAASVYFTQQNDDNFVFYSTNTAYGARAVWGVFANSATSNLQIYVPLQLNSVLVANGSPGVNGQVLTANSGGTPYWSAAAGGSTNVNATYAWTNTHTFTANVTVGNSTTNATFLTSYFGTTNPNTFTGGTITTTAGFNTVLAGPFTIATGNTLVVTTGSRVVIV